MARPKRELFPEELQELSLFAGALGHPARISMLMYLLKHGETGCMDLVGNIPLSQPTTSRHLAVLKESGLVRIRERGSQVFYAPERRRLRALTDFLKRTLGGKA